LSQLLYDVKEMVTEQVHYRELLYQMTKRDLLLRYKQTVMGFGWAIFMPLVNTAVFSVIFTRVAPIDVGVPYPIYAYCGLFAWNFFASSLRFAISSLTSNPNLVTKVYFPREIFPFSSTLVSLVDFAVSSLVLIAMMAWYGIVPTAAIVFLPVVLAVHVLFTAGMSLLVAMGNLFYRDVKYLFEVVLMVWMFATSVLYPAQLVGGRVGLLMELNPLTPILDGYRAALLFGRSPFTPAFALATLVSVTLVAAAWLIFHRAEFQFAENV
jgi:ABC-type polysaccharide/polyol phosphate export permease